MRLTRIILRAAMAAILAIPAAVFAQQTDLAKDFFVDLPKEMRPIPEPLAPGRQPGFKIRGTKGWMWTPEQYLAEIPILAAHKLNFLMNCYTSLFDIEHYPLNDPRSNRWWEPLPEGKRAAYAKVVKACQDNGLIFCFSMNPNYSSERFVNTGRKEDLDALWQHYEWMQSLGVKWFNISLDDISQGIDAAGQAEAVNEILRRLRAKDAEAQMIFCPTYYAGDGTEAKPRAYLEILSRELHPDIYVFWTGGAVCSARITRREAETFQGIVKRRVIIWDNYPVNNLMPTLQLGPVIGRDADLCEVVDGIMSNPHQLTNEINRLPLLTLADYAYNPAAYDPGRSIGQAILHLAHGDEQRALLKDLVEANPGMLFYNLCDCNYNSMRERFSQLAATPHSRFLVELYVGHIENLLDRLNRVFPDRYGPEKKILDQNVAWMKLALEAKHRGS
jgi:hypothetical protein